jgi:hypothetical protein
MKFLFNNKMVEYYNFNEFEFGKSGEDYDVLK